MSRTPFDLSAELPAGRAVIEASAGTGKTYSLTGLIVRYIAEAGVEADQFLVVTFTRAAANDLRDRTRAVLNAAVAATATGTTPDEYPWMSALVEPNGLGERHRRLTDAVNRFDDLTITTIHGFCQQALGQLGFRSGADPDTVLVENTRDLIAEVCRDLIIAELAEDPTALDSPRGSQSTVANASQAESELIANVVAVMTNPGAVQAPIIPSDEGATNCAGAVTDAIATSWLRLTRAAVEAVAGRQRARSEIGYDALIAGLRDALVDPVNGRAAAEQLAQRFAVVLVDEFQDTDRTQWEVFQRAFSGRTLITVGDPKQAIYRFRGADVHAYLDAVETTPVLTLSTNYRSDQLVLSGLEQLFTGATLGDPRIDFVPVRSRPAAPLTMLELGRGSVAPSAARPGAAVELRVVPLHDGLRAGQKRDLSMPLVRTLVLADLVGRTIDLLDHATIVTEGGVRPVQPGDVAVLVPSHTEANNVAEAMRRAKIPAVRTRTGSVLRSPAATEWRLLLTAMAQPHRSPAVRAGALGWFLPTDIVELCQSGDLLVALQHHVALMADQLRRVGFSAFFDEQKSRDRFPSWGPGLLPTVLGREGGERNLTDLDHIAELLAEALHGQSCEPAQVLRTLDDLITSTDDGSESAMRRIDSDALAVQITTVHSAKGLEYPIVLVPFGFKARSHLRRPYSYTDPDRRRVLDLASSVGWDSGLCVASDETSRLNQRARRNWAGVDTEADELRLLYVALTRAAHRVELWWAATQRATSSALGRLLLDRDGAGPVLNSPHRLVPKPPTSRGKPRAGFDEVKPPHHDLTEVEVFDQIQRLAAQSGGTIDITVIPEHFTEPVWAGRAVEPAATLGVATSPGRATTFDPSWKRWSFSRLSAIAESGGESGGESSTGVTGAAAYGEGGGEGPEPAGGLDEPEPAEELPPIHDIVGATGQLRLGLDPVAPLASVAGGTRFGTFVHEVFEHLDFCAPDLGAAVRSLVVEHLRLNGLDVPVEAVAHGLTAALRTPLGPLFAHRSLSEIPVQDRLAELRFDLPLNEGRSAIGAGPAELMRAGAIGEILLSTLPRADRLRPFATRLAGEMAGLDLSGWMHGSIDAVVRIPDRSGHRYLVIDYKTNRLHEPGAADPVAAYGPERLVAAMEHSRYPLQAVLYTVAVHRYLRWRLGPSYEPAHHLGGVGYLFVRGMVGPGTPTVDGVANGVFSWQPPIGAVLAIDQYFATGVRTWA